MPDYNSRDISAEAARTLNSMLVVVVTGMRQTGKTTFLRSDPALPIEHFSASMTLPNSKPPSQSRMDFSATNGPLP
jgi:hypothetical protein